MVQKNVNKEDSSPKKVVKPGAVDVYDGCSSGAARQQSSRGFRKKQTARGTSIQSLKIVHLGGLNEVGKNMCCIECGNDMIVVDCGMGFPNESMPGIDIVLPDYGYIEKNKQKLRGVVITHGHEDHIGGVPFFLKKFDVPVYGTRLTIGLIEEKLKERGLLKNAKLNVCGLKRVYRFGCIFVEMVAVNHSIPDSVGLSITTPVGVIVHTGDFKIDYNPISGNVIDLARFAELGSKGVLLLMADSTNAERTGHTMPERQVGESFKRLFFEAGNRRIIIASFSSNIHRIQQIVDNAAKSGRKVAISGRSMENVVEKAAELGYLKLPSGILVPIDSISKFSNHQIVIITTGSQGEPMSALSRMASGNHKNVAITSEDFVIISASPIPGNEKFVNNVVNDLMKLGAKVIYEKIHEIHTSGHAFQDELKTMLALTKPKYFMPVHGEYKHLKAHADLAISMGMPERNIIIRDLGKVVEITSKGLSSRDYSVPVGCVFVDGFGIGDVGSIVLKDRKILSNDGLLVVVAVFETATGQFVGGPSLVSRGFVYVKESEELLYEIKRFVRKIFDRFFEKYNGDIPSFKAGLREDLSNFVFKKIRRNPMILPIVMEI